MALRVSSPDLLERAHQAEEKDDLKRAASLYEQAIKIKPADEFAYNRLMIIYRKERLYKDELRIIKTGIKNFQELHNKKSIRKNSTVGRLSEALMKSAGLIDKKGNLLYEPGPIGKWKKRQLVVEKKINKR